MIYDQLIPQLQQIKELKEIPENVFFELLEATITTGMALSFEINRKEKCTDKMYETMMDLKTVINDVIDQQIEELKIDEG